MFGTGSGRVGTEIEVPQQEVSTKNDFPLRTLANPRLRTIPQPSRHIEKTPQDRFSIFVKTFLFQTRLKILKSRVHVSLYAK